ncbi:four helix bundle protein [Schnuerera sp.]|uniref:four helix bundle protein n=1 Tax=Schnuerera sp. TaxID=2794844 RepID=UPI002C4A8395|nr:four helix bundle protein [Schnuerera sp.]HSH37044.1 four helix bundle protein [Schnuerera sp.]
MTGNLIRDKSYEFALRIMKMYRHMIKNNVEHEIAKQLLRSGTSIGANVEEGCSAQSRKDFIHKLSIAQKEAFETRYWLRLLRDSGEIKKEHGNSMIKDCDELISILTSILKTTKANTK